MGHADSIRRIAPELFQKALEEERLRSGRLLRLLRFGGVSLFLALAVSQGAVRLPGFNYAKVLAGYWVVSLLLLLASQRSRLLITASALAIPFLDIPLVFLIQWLGFQDTESPRAISNFTISLYVLLLMMATMALRGWQLLVATIVAMCLQGTLHHLAGDTNFGKAGSAMVIGVSAVMCEYARRHRLQMVDSICRETLSRERLKRYFSPLVAEQIQKEGDVFEAGKQCEITVLFGDLCDFTAMSEKLGVFEVVELLNEFHGCMVEAVFEAGGTLDKYIGDGLMAYFGAPLAQPDHANRAVRCALDMQARLQRVNQTRELRGASPLRMRIGIHSGLAIVGSIGASSRREFTAVGDTVNLASRLEQVGKLCNEDIIISESTRQKLGSSFAVRHLKAFSVKGKLAPVETYAPEVGSQLVYHADGGPVAEQPK